MSDAIIFRTVGSGEFDIQYACTDCSKKILKKPDYYQKIGSVFVASFSEICDLCGEHLIKKEDVIYSDNDHVNADGDRITDRASPQSINQSSPKDKIRNTSWWKELFQF